MERLFEYMDESLFCHHSLDISPDPADFYVHAHERMELLLFISVNGWDLMFSTLIRTVN